MTDKASIGEWIRLAYEGCPPAEAYLAEELATLDTAARERLETHAQGCAACAAERDLARAFEAEASAAEVRDVERIARRLERRPPHGRERRWWSSGWAGLARRPAFQLGIAAVLVIGVGLGIRDAASPPRLGPGPGESAIRSSTLEVVAPLGELVEMPGALAWRGVDEASRYRVTVRGVDDSELWSVESRQATVAVDAALAARLREGVWYSWTVEALDEAGNRVAWSPETRFRVRPPE